ncbi:MAG TPA: alpha-L-fucosidase [Acidimicrobiia bacterium]|nr:alpha-L-fucosidase [Acidimicrobiia bacterium]
MSLRNPRLQRLRAHRVPAWWLDAKLGIFVHWTPASVPAFAPVDVDIGTLVQSGRRDALACCPYAEWYENSLRFPQSPVARHHREVYGVRPYTEFARDWEAALEQWDPHEWAARFASTGARYVVLVTKHMDGYCLWPTDVHNPRRAGWNCRRDVVGEFSEAVRGAGMRFGIYYSGGLDSTFNARPIGSVSEMLDAIPRGDYPAYAEAQVRELIDRYRPSVLWNDIAWPSEGKQLWSLFEYYYATVPDGLVNDRWMPWNPILAATRSQLARRAIDAGVRRQAERDTGVVPPTPPHSDVRTPEYVAFDDVQRKPWECVRGMDRSFGYNACSGPEHFLGHAELLWMFTDIVAKGGNLLLNVGPRGVDAQIPDEQLTRLGWLARWVPRNSDAIAATRPWVVPGTTTGDGSPVRYTARDHSVYAFVRDVTGSIVLPDVGATSTTTVTGIDGAGLAWNDSPAGITIDTPTTEGPEPHVVALRHVAARNATSSC